MKRACIAAIAAACVVTPAIGAEHSSKGRFKYTVSHSGAPADAPGAIDVTGGCDWSANTMGQVAVVGRFNPAFASPDGKIRGGKVTALTSIPKGVTTSNVKSIRIDVGPDFVNTSDPNDVRQGSIYFPTNTKPNFKRIRNGSETEYVPVTHPEMFANPTLDHSLQFSRDPNHVVTFNLPEDSQDGDLWELNLAFDAIYRPLDDANPENGNLEEGKNYSTTLIYTCFSEPNGS